MIKFRTYIHPQPKGRPRFNSTTRRTFTPASTSKFQKAFQFSVLNLLDVEKVALPIFGEGVPLILSVDFVFSRPKRLMRKKDPDGFLWRPNSEDLDNLEKSVMDSLNGILWLDDRQICKINSRKLYGPKGSESFISVCVRRLGEPPVFLCDSRNNALFIKENELDSQEEDLEKTLDSKVFNK